MRRRGVRVAVLVAILAAMCTERGAGAGEKSRRRILEPEDEAGCAVQDVTCESEAWVQTIREMEAQAIEQDLKDGEAAGDETVAEENPEKLTAQQLAVPQSLNGETLSRAQSQDGTQVLRGQDKVGSKPHILLFMMDDLGWDDVAYNSENPRQGTRDSTPRISALAKEGIVLTRHYGHWHCSPSRRSFLSGRLPIHVGGDDLTDWQDDDMDMRFTWISEKLKAEGYYNLFYGKGHIGVKSIRMLPAHRGFDDHFGFLDGSQSYFGNGLRWDNLRPSTNKDYSVFAYGVRMYDKIEAELKKASPRPIFLFSSMQTPHTPEMAPPSKIKRYAPPSGARFSLLQRMMYAGDVEIERTVSLFREDEAVWNNTFIVFVSDNGGTTSKTTGNNFPLRGEKGTSFEGGYRVTGFVSGGIIPEELRGTKNDKISHLMDWYRTFCNLAGADGDDDPPQPPQFADATAADVLDPQYPDVDVGQGKVDNVYGDMSYPKVDAKDLWPVLMNPELHAIDAVHPSLVLSNEVMLKGHMKLILAQPCSMGVRSDIDGCKQDADFGWKDRNMVWSPTAADPAIKDLPCIEKYDYREREAYLRGDFRFKPCLFNISDDFREEENIVDVDMIRDMWTEFNQTLTHQYTIRLARKRDYGMTPFFCTGPCHTPKLSLSFFNSRNSATMTPKCGIYQIAKQGFDFCPDNVPIVSLS